MSILVLHSSIFVSDESRAKVASVGSAVNSTRKV